MVGPGERKPGEETTENHVSIATGAVRAEGTVRQGGLGSHSLFNEVQRTLVQFRLLTGTEFFLLAFVSPVSAFIVARHFGFVLLHPTSASKL